MGKEKLEDVIAATEEWRARFLQTVIGPSDLKIIERTSRELREWENSFSQLKRAWESSFSQFKNAIQSQAEQLSGKIVAPKELASAFKQSAEIMEKNGWWILPSLPLAFYSSRLIRVKDQITPETLTTLITRYANEDSCAELTRIVSAWTVDFFQRRKGIFEQTLWVHCREKYAVTVPALVVQIEGIIRDFVEVEVGFTSWHFDRVRDRFTKKFGQIEAVPQEERMEAIMNFYNLKALERLYNAHSPTSHADPSDVNRHALSHGLWLSYAKEEYSTKLFLLLDMLHSMLHQLQRT